MATRKTDRNPKLSARMTLNTLPKTVAYPSIAHAQGTNEFKFCEVQESPRGKGIPMKNPDGKKNGQANEGNRKLESPGWIRRETGGIETTQPCCEKKRKNNRGH